MLVLRPRPPPEVGRSVGPFRPPNNFRRAPLRAAVGRSVQTDSIFSSPRSARQCRAVPTLIFLAALRAAVGRSDRSDPKFSSPRSARRSVGRTRPTRNRPLAREVGRSVGDAKPTINIVPPGHELQQCECRSLGRVRACEPCGVWPCQAEFMNCHERRVMNFVNSEFVNFRRFVNERDQFMNTGVHHARKGRVL